MLFRHSMAVLAAIRWAQEHPSEVAAVVGLDPAVPSAYEDIDLSGRIVLGVTSAGARLGVTPFLPAIVEDSAAIKESSLTEHNKDDYRAAFYRRTQTSPMVEEVRCVKDNAEKVDELPLPQLPMLFFTSDGEGTGLDAQRWREHQTSCLSRVSGSQQVMLDSGHHVHDLDPETIAAKSRQLIQDLGASDDE